MQKKLVSEAKVRVAHALCFRFCQLTSLQAPQGLVTFWGSMHAEDVWLLTALRLISPRGQLRVPLLAKGSREHVQSAIRAGESEKGQPRRAQFPLCSRVRRMDSSGEYGARGSFPAQRPLVPQEALKAAGDLRATATPCCICLPGLQPAPASLLTLRGAIARRRVAESHSLCNRQESPFWGMTLPPPPDCTIATLFEQWSSASSILPRET